MSTESIKIVDVRRIDPISRPDQLPLWKRSIGIRLTRQGFNRYLNTVPGEPDRQENESEAAYNTRIVAQEKRIQAFAEIMDCCGTMAYDIVTKAEDEDKTVLQAIALVEDQFKQDKMVQTNHAVNKLLSLRLANTTNKSDVAELGESFKQVWEELADMDATQRLPELFVVQFFLRALNEDYNQFVVNYINNHSHFNEEGKTKASLNDAIASASNFSLKLSDSSAFFNSGNSNRSSNNGRSPGSRQYDNPLCDRCKKHHKGVCWLIDDSNAPKSWKERHDKKQTESSSKRKRRSSDSSEEYSSIGPAGPPKRANMLLRQPDPQPEDSIVQDVYFATNQSMGESMAIYHQRNLYNVFILDSGANGSLIGRKDLFVDNSYTEFAAPAAASQGVGGSVTPTGKGTIELLCRATVDGKAVQRRLRIPDVHYSPTVGVNLLSISQFWPSIYRLQQHDNGLTFYQGSHQFSASWMDGLLVIDM